MIKYKYVNRVSWSGKKPNLMVIGEYQYTDATVKQILKFAREHKFGSLTYCNLYASMNTSKIYSDRIGPENNHQILKAAYNADTIICAWGDSKLGDNRAVQVLNLLSPFKLFCIGLTHQQKQPRKFDSQTYTSVEIVKFVNNPYTEKNLSLKILEILEQCKQSDINSIQRKIPDSKISSLQIICQDLVRCERIYSIDWDTYSIEYPITRFTIEKINVLKNLRKHTTDKSLDLLNGVISDLQS